MHACLMIMSRDVPVCACVVADDDEDAAGDETEIYTPDAPLSNPKSVADAMSDRSLYVFVCVRACVCACASLCECVRAGVCVFERYYMCMRVRARLRLPDKPVYTAERLFSPLLSNLDLHSNLVEALSVVAL